MKFIVLPIKIGIRSCQIYFIASFTTISITITLYNRKIVSFKVIMGSSKLHRRCQRNCLQAYNTYRTSIRAAFKLAEDIRLSFD